MVRVHPFRTGLMLKTGRLLSGRHTRLSWPLVIGALTYLASLLSADRLLADPDTYWHVAAGRWMLEHGTVPAHDPFSHSIPQAPWTAHEWLSEIILAATYSAGGWPGIVVISALSFALTLAILCGVSLTS